MSASATARDGAHDDLIEFERSSRGRDAMLSGVELLPVREPECVAIIGDGRA